MISKPWRDRLGYLAMSLFIGWHAVAIVIAPAPDDSPLVQSSRVLFWPYLTLFRLENTWAFFEHVPRSPQFRYVIQDVAGKEHTFAPIEDFKWFHPRWNWFERSYWAIMEYPEFYGDYFAAAFCRQHAELNPVSITLLMVVEQEFWPGDQLAGHHPLDPEFVTVNPLLSADCPSH